VNTLGVVIPCYAQERFLARTLAALREPPAGWSVSGALVLAAPAASELPALDPSWRVIAAPANASRPLTPGAARMRGLAACAGPWVLFVDADVEVDAAWLAAALARVTRADAEAPRLGGLWGRIEEWFVDGARERAGSPDLYRIGTSEHAVDYLATLALYRRAALAEAGGYDARLNSEEDFELGLRLRARGWELRAIEPRAARHWSAPRPSFAELGRRWRTGLCFGQGQVLRLYAGRPGFATLLRRQGLYVATLAGWALGLAAAAVWLARGPAWPMAGWALALVLGVALLTARKRSPRLAAHALLTWTLNGLGMLVGWFRADRNAPREVTC